MLENKILTITEPTIKKDTIKVFNTQKVEDFKYTNVKEITGAKFPHIQINKLIINRDEISQFSIELTNRIPTLSISFKDISGQMSGMYYPKDGDVVSIYIKPSDKENFREIRADFDITEFEKIDPSTNTYLIKGVLKVPKLFSDFQKSIPNSSSFDALNSVADELKLGFASNLTVTNDIQTWINPNDTYIDFINEISNHGFIDDDSFVTSFIDIHYYLNYVNVNTQFDIKETEISIITANIETSEFKYDNEDDATKNDVRSEFPLYLTNFNKLQGSTNFIEKWSLISNTASVWIDNGYSRDIYYSDYNDTEENCIIFNIDPLTSRSDDKVILKGRPNDDSYLELKKKRWMGSQLTDIKNAYNVHKDFLYAKLHNLQNNQEIEKMGLEIIIAKANFYLYRYQAIPIVIYEYDATNNALIKNRDKAVNQEGLNEKEKNSSDVKTSNDSFFDIKGDVTTRINTFLSGTYLIKDIVFFYDTKSRVIKQKLKVIRREMPLQFKNNTNYDVNK